MRRLERLTELERRFQDFLAGHGHWAPDTQKRRLDLAYQVDQIHRHQDTQPEASQAGSAAAIIYRAAKRIAWAIEKVNQEKDVNRFWETPPADTYVTHCWGDYIFRERYIFPSSLIGSSDVSPRAATAVLLSTVASTFFHGGLDFQELDRRFNHTFRYRSSLHQEIPVISLDAGPASPLFIGCDTNIPRGLYLGIDDWSFRDRYNFAVIIVPTYSGME